ncbi:TadE/TadG family type IV pilus assembly protein [Neorhizobium huautlense]|jgi:hypothetical protein|uniref:TadE/TadG family type IV pilus assembly protein n=1 Tax=Neorhizobium huautlense TaxID=67774 RepID=UPI000CF9966C|nr:vWA domain-containing protein [Neorhizobium huautlense]
MLGKLLRDRSGNFGLMSALMLVPLIGVAGLSIDFADALMIKQQLQDAADAAALGAVAESSIGVSEAMKMKGNGSIEAAIKDAENIFRAQLARSGGFTLNDIKATVVREDNQLKAVFTYSASLPTTLLKVINKNEITVAGQATAVFQTETFRDFYLLLDNTPSMGVGATPDDISVLIANTPKECAFACHIVENGVEDPNSYYNIAKRLGVTIRINVVAQATAALMDTAMKVRKSPNQFRMAVYTFGEKAEDTKLLEISSLSDDLKTAKEKAALIDLMSIPYQNYDNDQQTDFDRALKNIGKKMDKPGTGLSAASPEKIVFFVSDGVNDSGKGAGCTKRTKGTRCQEPIDIRACDKLKEAGYKIAVLYTTYLPLPTDGWYRDWIAPFQGEIGPRMQSCATPGYFFEVSPSQGITEAMNALFLKIVSTPRLAS